MTEPHNIWLALSDRQELADFALADISPDDYRAWDMAMEGHRALAVYRVVAGDLELWEMGQ